MKKDLKINFSVKDFPKNLSKSVKKISKYSVFVFAVVTLGLYGFLVYIINNGAQAKPSEDQVSQQLGTAKRLKIDQASVDKMKQLEAQNVEVKSLFKSARDDPFRD